MMAVRVATPSDTKAMAAASLSDEPVRERRPYRVKVMVAAAIGNALEFYDFVVYAYFAAYIGRAFFPPSAPMTGLLAALAVFGVGFVARPLGAVAMGAYSDRRGRRPTLLLSMGLIAAATTLIAVLPTYSQLGATAPVLLVLCRLVQGFAYGAEIGPAAAYMLEAAPSSRAGLYCLTLFAGQGVAACLAGLFGTGLASVLKSNEMQDWGWRLPFVAGAALTPVALYLRRHMPETLATSNVPAGATIVHDPRRNRASKVFLLTIVLLGGTVANYVITYLPTYAATTLAIPMSRALSTAIVVGAVTFCFGLLGGYVSDRVGRRPALVWARIGCTTLALPAFAFLVAHPTNASLWAVAALLAGINALAGGALLAAIPESFDAHSRAAAMSIVYASGVAIFGGSTQFVVAWLIEKTGDPTAPSWYMVVTGAVACLATLALRETHPPTQRNTSAV